MKLYACILDRETAKKEWVTLCQFDNDDNEKVFIEYAARHNEETFKVLIDEGYVQTYYYYPLKRYSITHLEILK